MLGVYLFIAGVAALDIGKESTRTNVSLANTSTSEADTHIVNAFSHDMKLKDTLQFVTTTLKYTLLEHDRAAEIFKTIQDDSSVQDQLKSLSASVRSKMIEIDGLVDAGTGLHIIRRQHSSDSASVDVFTSASLPQFHVSAALPEFREASDSRHAQLEHRINNALNFVSTTLQHSLNTFGGAKFKKLQVSTTAQIELHDLARSVKTQLQDIIYLTEGIKGAVGGLLAFTTLAFLLILFIELAGYELKLAWLCVWLLIQMVALGVFLLTN